MSAETIVCIVSVLCMLGTIAGVVFALGKRDARLDALEARVKEDREKNSAQHEAFYENGRAMIGIASDLKNVGKQVDDMQLDIREILNRLPPRAS